MAFKKDSNLNNYDVFPKVFTVGKKAKITIRPLGGSQEFVPGQSYILIVCALDNGTPWEYPSTAEFTEIPVVCSSDGGFSFSYTFLSEQMYFLRLCETKSGEYEKYNRINQFSVYAVNTDLVGRYPFLGDLHMHTTRSDGRQCPAVVAANYRRHGYDFTVISDHGRYYPSLEAINFYKDIPTELTIIPGEEVHPQSVGEMQNGVHMVNFGGEYSVNALVEGSSNYEDKGNAPEYRSLNGTCPEVMTKEEYDKMIIKLCNETQTPEGIDKMPAVSCKWFLEQIKKANGLSIFAHPNWIANVYHVSEKFTDYMMKEQWFDAFEVLGGENYYEQNGFQTQRYYEDVAAGRRYPVVGSTDSHNSYSESRNAFICSTIVFANQNERTALINSVKGFYSVAVDTINEDFRLVGENRLCRYACFLLKNWFPLHDELCEEEGRLMKQYATGTEDEKQEALKILSAINGRVKRAREKYFDF